jgi:hypothetical protein
MSSPIRSGPSSPGRAFLIGGAEFLLMLYASEENRHCSKGAVLSIDHHHHQKSQQWAKSMYDTSGRPSGTSASVAVRHFCSTRLYLFPLFLSFSLFYLPPFFFCPP